MAYEFYGPVRTMRVILEAPYTDSNCALSRPTEGKGVPLHLLRLHQQQFSIRLSQLGKREKGVDLKRGMSIQQKRMVNYQLILEAQNLNSSFEKARTLVVTSKGPQNMVEREELQ